MSKYDNLYWSDIKDIDYDNLIEDLEHNMIKLDDGTTLFNIYCIGQNVAHDMLIDKVYDEEMLCVSESDIIDYINEHFYDVIIECMKEVKIKLNDNGIKSYY